MEKHTNPSLWRRAMDCPILHPEAAKDCILPDSYPDIHKILYTGAHIVPGHTHLTAGKLQTEGMLYCSVLFADEDGKPHGVRFAVEYAGQMPYSSDDGEMILVADTVMDSITARAVNPRKLAIRGKITVHPYVLFRCEEEPTLAPELTSVKLEKKLQTVTCRRLISWGEQGVEASEDLSLGQEPPISEIVWSDLQMEVTSCEAVDGEVRFNGTGLLHLFYLTPDGRVQYANTSFPIRSSLQGDAMEEDLCKVVLTPEEVTVVPTEDAAGEARGVELDFTYSIAVTVIRKENSTRPVDCYSAEEPTATKEETVNLFTDAGELYGEYSRTLEGEASGMKAVNGAFARIGVDSREQGEDSVILHCAAQVTVIGMDEDGRPMSISLADNFPLQMTLPENTEYLGCRFQLNSQPMAVLEGDQIKVRLTFRLCGLTLQSDEVTYVGSVVPATGDLPSAKDSLTLCYPAPGETLWDIAKRYRIPQRSILSANDIPEGALPAVLLIPH